MIFKRLIEKLYYKAYPDRVNDHAIATAPIIPEYHVYERSRYHAVTVKASELIPSVYVSTGGEELEKLETEIKRELFRKMEPEISKRIEIHKVFLPDIHTVAYEGYFRFYEED